MFYSGICFGTNDLDKAGKFYDLVFKTINVVRCQTTDNEIGYGSSIDEECFWIIKPFNKEPATRGNGSQMIITANSKNEVDLFYAAALKAGGYDEGAPGLRAVSYTHLTLPTILLV